MMVLLIFLLLFINEGYCLLNSPTFEAADVIAKRVATRAKNAIDEGSWGYYKNFGTWNYEGAMVYRGLWEIQSALSEHVDFDIETFLNDRLDFFQVNMTGPRFK